MFRLVQTGISGGTSLRGEIELPPAFMIERFGEHDDGDCSSTSGGWTFVSESGEVFTVYEWRGTTVSNVPWSGSPTEDAFWASWRPVSLHIGAMPDSDWQAFACGFKRNTGHSRAKHRDENPSFFFNHSTALSHAVPEDEDPLATRMVTV